MSNTLIESLEWRYATKSFDPSKKVSNDKINIIKRAIQLTATSYGLQLYKVLIIEDNTIREQLLAHSHNQKKIVDASHLFILCRYNHIDEAMINNIMNEKSKASNIPRENLNAAAENIIKNINSISEEQLHQWLSKQLYSVMTNVLTACANLKIDACPMEGFISKSYDEALGLDAKNLASVVVIPVGYRSSEDNAQYTPKFRLPIDSLIEHIQ